MIYLLWLRQNLGFRSAVNSWQLRLRVVLGPPHGYRLAVLAEVV
jgi:hypothetical protein